MSERGELEEIEAGISRLEDALRETREEIMATLAELATAEGQEAGEIGQLVTAFNAQTTAIADLQAQIAALQPGTLTAEQQAQIDSTFADIQAQTSAVAAVLPAVTPPAPAPTPEPPVPPAQ